MSRAVRHEGEAQLSRACGSRVVSGAVSGDPTPHAWPAALTQHLADVGLDVHVLQVLVGVGVVEPQCGVQADGHPDPAAKSMPAAAPGSPAVGGHQMTSVGSGQPVNGAGSPEAATAEAAHSRLSGPHRPPSWGPGTSPQLCRRRCLGPAQTATAGSEGSSRWAPGRWAFTARPPPLRAFHDLGQTSRPLRAFPCDPMKPHGGALPHSARICMVLG